MGFVATVDIAQVEYYKTEQTREQIQFIKNTTHHFKIPIRFFTKALNERQLTTLGNWF